MVDGVVCGVGGWVWVMAGDGSELTADCGRVDDGQTILSVLKQSVWPSSVVPIQRTADGLTTDRQILSVLKQSISEKYLSSAP